MRPDLLDARVRQRCMLAASQKKVIVRLFPQPGDLAQTVHAGYLPASGFVLRETNTLPMLDLAGRMVPVPLGSVKWVAYVHDFNGEDAVEPERLVRRTFLARPRLEGLWIRATFRDADVLEGLAALDTSLLDDAIADLGLFIMPADSRGNTVRLYMPRTALTSLVALSVVLTPSKDKTPARKPIQTPALSLPFPE